MLFSNIPLGLRSGLLYVLLQKFRTFLSPMRAVYSSYPWFEYRKAILKQDTIFFVKGPAADATDAPQP